MPPSLRELMEAERERRARVERAFGDIADAVRSIARASSRIEETVASWSFGEGEPRPSAKTAASRAARREASGNDAKSTVAAAPGPNGHDATPARTPAPPAAPESGPPFPALGEALALLDGLREQSASVATRLLNLVDAADELGRKLGGARELAERIDLLILNAALEASRGDAAATGFARAASEIRDQVVRWIRATQEIAPVVSTLREELGRTLLTADTHVRTSTAARHDVAHAGQALEHLTDMLRRTLHGAAAATAPRSAPSPGPLTADGAAGQAEQLANDLRSLGVRLEELLLGEER